MKREGSLPPKDDGLIFLGSGVITIPSTTEFSYFWQQSSKWGRNHFYNILTKIKR